ncbi:uncharacterized protein N7498_009038 [Penicillium cinerascens]|uniref:Uncharacterized protein n=1 Tax=Penicillium cinerascens TaxID=70096 RepID=A0A9W9JIM6_9EURO|nr:uncharacterized protein N7498_009038 [Penicillium cinerascens]KAJ5195600.1 hypothetical protein N7498_009038 [Penicillium cinerascens]
MLPRTPAPLRHRRTCWIEAQGRRVRESQGIAKLAFTGPWDARNRCDSAAGDMTLRTKLEEEEIQPDELEYSEPIVEFTQYIVLLYGPCPWRATTADAWKFSHGCGRDAATVPSVRERTRSRRVLALRCKFIDSPLARFSYIGILKDVEPVRVDSLFNRDIDELERNNFDSDARADLVDDVSFAPGDQVPGSVKLRKTFHNPPLSCAKSAVRLHGTRLPTGYTTAPRMDKSIDFVRPIREGPKRR